MKLISQENLEILIPMMKCTDYWGVDEFKILLDHFGDDFFIEDGEFKLVCENEKMKGVMNNGQC